MPDLNIFNINLQNLVKLYEKGRIVSVYHKMYKEAERLANKEFDLFMHEEFIRKRGQDTLSVFESIIQYRKDRIEYHYNEMKQLFERSLKYKSKK